MRNAIEKMCINAIENFYQGESIGFGHAIDDNAVLYGPVKGQVINGKNEILSYLGELKDKFSFDLDNIVVKLVPLKYDSMTVLVEFDINALRRDGRSSQYTQHIVIDLHRRMIDGRYFWKCPFIHVSNVLKNAAQRRAETENKTGSDIKSRKSSGKVILRGHGGANFYISPESIIYAVGGKGHTTDIVTENGTVTVNHLLKEIMPLLAESDFHRCHASYIVNISHVSFIEAYRLVLDTGETIPVPEKKFTKVRQEIREKLQSVK